MSRLENRTHHDILQLFGDAKTQLPGFLKVSAPMVRYSKLEFRQLLRLNSVQLTFTPMIIADSFNNSQKARDNEFKTTADDTPVVAQFAACNAEEFSTAAQLIYPYVDGVDLNCGCPQSWAIAKTYGCGLLRQPEIIRDIVQTARRCLPSDFSISIKFRVVGSGKSEESSTVELARQLEHCGATFLTLHGRTMKQSTAEPVNIDVVKAVKNSLQIPLIANGNVRTWQDACDLHEATQADGIMAARGLLTNPTLFNQNYTKTHKSTCLACVEQWLNIAAQAGDSLQFQCFHHHLTFMWNNNMKRSERVMFNQLSTKEQILDFFENKYGIKPSNEAQINPFTYTKCTYTHFQAPSNIIEQKNGDLWHESSQGKFFKEFTTKKDMKNNQIEFGLEDSFFMQSLMN